MANYSPPQGNSIEVVLENTSYTPPSGDSVDLEASEIVPITGELNLTGVGSLSIDASANISADFTGTSLLDITGTRVIHGGIDFIGNAIIDFDLNLPELPFTGISSFVVDGYVSKFSGLNLSISSQFDLELSDNFQVPFTSTGTLQVSGTIIKESNLDLIASATLQISPIVNSVSALEFTGSSSFQVIPNQNHISSLALTVSAGLNIIGDIIGPSELNFTSNATLDITASAIKESSLSFNGSSLLGIIGSEQEDAPLPFTGSAVLSIIPSKTLFSTTDFTVNSSITMKLSTEKPTDSADIGATGFVTHNTDQEVWAYIRGTATSDIGASSYLNTDLSLLFKGHLVQDLDINIGASVDSERFSEVSALIDIRAETTAGIIQKGFIPYSTDTEIFATSFTSIESSIGSSARDFSSADLILKGHQSLEYDRYVGATSSDLSSNRFYQIYYNSFGAELVDGTYLDCLINIAARLQTETHNTISEIPKLRDIDTVPSEFVKYIQREVSTKTPALSDLDAREFVKEAKTWYSGKGSKQSYDYISALTNTYIELYEPSRNIMTLNSKNTLLSGYTSSSLDPEDYISPGDGTSYAGFIRDGIRWSYYTYVVRVKGGNNVNLSVLTDLLDLVHPAGTQYWVEIFLESYLDKQEDTTLTVKVSDWITDYKYIDNPKHVPTISGGHGFILNDKDSLLNGKNIGFGEVEVPVEYSMSIYVDSSTTTIFGMFEEEYLSSDPRNNQGLVGNIITDFGIIDPYYIQIGVPVDFSIHEVDSTTEILTYSQIEDYPDTSIRYNTLETAKSDYSLITDGYMYIQAMNILVEEYLWSIAQFNGFIDDYIESQSSIELLNSVVVRGNVTEYTIPIDEISSSVIVIPMSVPDISYRSDEGLTDSFILDSTYYIYSNSIISTEYDFNIPIEQSLEAYFEIFNTHSSNLDINNNSVTYLLVPETFRLNTVDSESEVLNLLILEENALVVLDQYQSSKADSLVLDSSSMEPYYIYTGYLAESTEVVIDSSSEIIGSMVLIQDSVEVSNKYSSSDYGTLDNTAFADSPTSIYATIFIVHNVTTLQDLEDTLEIELSSVEDFYSIVSVSNNTSEFIVIRDGP